MQDEDEYFRYKMPDLVLGQEGRGGNTKTLIANLDELAKSLQRSPSEIMKYFGYELGTQTKQNYLKGIFTKNDLSALLQQYIKQFILCDLCLLPSTSYKIRKSSIKLICSSCGSKRTITDHKLVSFIQKNKASAQMNL